VYPQENGLHKRPAFRTKEISNEIPLICHHTLFRSIPVKVCLRLHAPLGPPLTKLIHKTRNRKSTQVNLREKRLHQIHRVKSLLILFLLGPPRPVIHIFPCAPSPIDILPMRADQSYVLACFHISSTLPAFGVVHFSYLVAPGLL